MLFCIFCGTENTCGIDLSIYPEKRCISEYLLKVYLIVSGVHNDVFQPEGYIPEPLKSSQTECHEHRVLTARNADSNFVAFLNETVLLHGFVEFFPDGLVEFSCDSIFNWVIDVQCMHLRAVSMEQGSGSSQCGLVTQPELICNKGDELGISWLTLTGINGVTEERVEYIDVSPVPGYFYCVTNGTFHS